MQGMMGRRLFSMYFKLTTASDSLFAASGGPTTTAGLITTSDQRLCWAQMDQAAHSLSVLDLLHHKRSDWVKAQRDFLRGAAWLLVACSIGR